MYTFLFFFYEKYAIYSISYQRIIKKTKVIFILEGHLICCAIEFLHKKEYNYAKTNNTRQKNIMKNNLHFIIIHCLIAVSPCTAMELDLKKCNLFEKPKILSEITIIKEPWQAEYLAEDRVIINGKDGCCIINPKTNKAIKRIDVQAQHFALHPTTKKIAFSGENPAIYSTTGDLEVFIQTNNLSITKSVFDPLNNNILLEDTGDFSRSYDCETGNQTGIGAGRISFVAFHPTQKIVYMCHPIGGWFRKPCIEIYSSTTLQQTGRIGLGDHCNPTYILCSPNGAWIAVQYVNKAVYIIKHHDQTPITHCIELPTIKNILFHPNSAVLATVMPLCIDRERHEIVFYWDVITQQLITTMPPFPTRYHHIHKNIAFSPNGKELMVVLPDKCITLPVPFEVLYNTTEKLPHLYLFLLKEWLNQHDAPKDVQKIIAFNLIEAKFKR